MGVATVLAALVMDSTRAETVKATSYVRYFFTEPGAHQAVQASGELSGNRSGAAGWVEYVFSIATSGWHELSAEGPATGVEFLIDTDEDGEVPDERYFYHAGPGRGGQLSKIGNVWLDAGTHRVRVSRFYWTGFPPISGIDLRRSDDSPGQSTRAIIPRAQHVFRAGECPAITVLGGGTPRAATVHVTESRSGTGPILARHSLHFPASSNPLRQTVQLACSEGGPLVVRFFATGSIGSTEMVHPVTFEIIDPAVRVPADIARSAEPLVDIDCAAREPDYSSRPSTRVSQYRSGRYRESGDNGWIPYQRASAEARQRSAGPSWFAYTLPGILPQQRYRVEIDFPDDAARTFAAVWRESAPLWNPVAVAVETGGRYPLSNAARTLTFNAWSRTSAPRLLLIPAHDGTRAACSRIRVYAAPPRLPVASSASRDRRQFLHWYEENDTFAGLFGAPDSGFRGIGIAVERWAQAAMESGMGMLMPTVAVYGSTLYPSRFHQSFSSPHHDVLRTMVLTAEKYGLEVVPELHPRADELAYGRTHARETPGNLLLSRDGTSNFFRSDGSRNFPPYFNPLLPANQQWYVQMIAELARRYADSPAFTGVSLRYMDWANPALNNFVNIEWGYDDYSVAAYKRETGSRVPLGVPADAGRFRARYEWLISNERTSWIEWRCRKMAQLTGMVRDAVREARPDLTVYIHVFSHGGMSRGRAAEQLREAGLDVAMLGALEGVTVVDSTHAYGWEDARRAIDGSWDMLLDADASGVAPLVVPTSHYLEATDAIAPPAMLGFPESTRATWMSTASNRAGRLALERFAVALADTDTLALGDGGNNYIFGSPAVEEFVREFRRLPRVRFDMVSGRAAPVIMRALASPEEYVFYAVNRRNHPVQLAVRLGGEGRVTHRDGTEEIHPGKQTLRLELQAYELRVFSATPAIRISGVETDVADERK